MFALLCRFPVHSINGVNNATNATRFNEFHDTSDAPLKDAVGNPKLIRPRSCFLWARESKNLFFGVYGL
jgi:hypothetical protein